MFRIAILVLFCVGAKTFAQDYTPNCARTPKSGVHKILYNNGTHDHHFEALCDQSFEDGGWTVILQRFNGSLITNRDLSNITSGFGNVYGEFFIGLEKLYALTQARTHSLVLLMEDFDNNAYVTRLPEIHLHIPKSITTCKYYDFSYPDYGITTCPEHKAEWCQPNGNVGWTLPFMWKPTTQIKLNLFGKYWNTKGLQVKKDVMGFYNADKDDVLPLRSLKIMIKPVNMFRKSKGESYMENFYTDNSELLYNRFYD